ncbi:hypothetical protein Tco_1447288 [Tanacetum coccineum]
MEKSSTDSSFFIRITSKSLLKVYTLASFTRLVPMCIIRSVFYAPLAESFLANIISTSSGIASDLVVPRHRLADLHPTLLVLANSPAFSKTTLSMLMEVYEELKEEIKVTMENEMEMLSY